MDRRGIGAAVQIPSLFLYTFTDSSNAVTFRSNGGDFQYLSRATNLCFMSKGIGHRGEHAANIKTRHDTLRP